MLCFISFVTCITGVPCSSPPHSGPDCYSVGHQVPVRPHTWLLLFFMPWRSSPFIHLMLLCCMESVQPPQRKLVLRWTHWIYTRSLDTLISLFYELTIDLYCTSGFLWGEENCSQYSVYSTHSALVGHRELHFKGHIHQSSTGHPFILPLPPSRHMQLSSWHALSWGTTWTV